MTLERAPDGSSQLMYLSQSDQALDILYFIAVTSSTAIKSLPVIHICAGFHLATATSNIQNVVFFLNDCVY